MHPIERLRYVARSQGVPADVLVPESAAALMAFRHDPAGMVAACRRIVDRQVDCGQLWWLCSRILCGLDVLEEARAAVEEFTSDPTPDRLAEAVDGLGDEPVPAIVEARACGATSAVVDGRAVRRLEAASPEAPVWLVAPVGTVLPEATFEVLCSRWSDLREESASPAGLVELSAFSAVVRPKGILPPERATRRADCPVAPELFHRPG
jgi:hypothetical protein